MGPDDRFYGFGEVRTGTKDVWAYDTEDRELGSFWLGGDQGIWDHKLSGDGKRLVVSNPSGLKVVTTP
ncbi:hypothetical protein [Archangium sp.]|uniref:hypothetical protein n=1 Tax=Archangium sp. TaxID=1872627 RepID=UPI002D42F30B|nr:hypothetical protein [Archangium sp.]HYO56336.1 hypothetical protein [Archangium sp.]